MYKIVWTPTATDTYYQILEYLIDNWSLDVALKFDNQTKRLTDLLIDNKFLSPPSKLHKLIRKCSVTKHNSLIQVVKCEIHLITFLDNRTEVAI